MCRSLNHSVQATFRLFRYNLRHALQHALDLGYAMQTAPAPVLPDSPALHANHAPLGSLDLSANRARPIVRPVTTVSTAPACVSPKKP
jgi:hypothetical protein